MFLVNDYNSSNNSFDITPVSMSGSGSSNRGRGTKRVALELATYFFALLVLILEITEPMSGKKALSNLKSNQSVFTLFISFSIFVPLLTFLVMYIYDGMTNSQKKKKSGGVIAGMVIMTLFHFALTITAIVYSKPDIGKTSQAYLYSKVILIFFAIMFILITQILGKECK